MAGHASLVHLQDGTRNMEERDDGTLLKAIAQQRDHGAFTALYERYQSRAFNLAYHVLGDSTLAQDAVQDAMLAIWGSATAAQLTGNAADWIMRIVINKSINLRSGQKRRTKREADVMEQNAPHVAAENAEDRELMTQLRQQINQLPELERSVLACSYCTSMSHREIAKVVGIPHRTVTYKIQAALERLRLNLTKAGVAAAVPLLGREALYESLTTGHASPPGMAESMMQKVHNFRPSARSLSRRVVASRGGWLVPLGITTVITAVLGASAWFVYARGNPTQSVQSSGAAVTQVKPNEDAPIHLHWSFDKGPVDDLKVVRESWVWQRTPEYGGMMITPTKESVLVGIPAKMPSHPFMVTLKGRVPTGVNSSLSVGMGWMDASYAWPIGNRQWHKHLNLTRPGDNRVTVNVYFIDRYTINCMNGETNLICEASEPYPSPYISLACGRVNVESIDIRSLAPNEIPESLRDIPKMIEQFGGQVRYCDEHWKVTPVKE